MNKEIDNLIKHMEVVEKELFLITVQLEQTSATTSIFYAVIERKVKKLYKEAFKIFEKWAMLNVPRAYNNEMKQQINRIKKMIFKPKNILHYNKAHNTRISNRAKKITINTAISDFANGISKGLVKYKKLIMATRTTNRIQVDINNAIADDLKGPVSVFETKKKIQKALMKSALNKEYITIRDKNGKLRNYRINKYSDMVARTKITEVQTRATINTANGVGADLIQVSSHNTVTPFDQQFEGKVFSISGESKKFPPVTVLPPFHPNCIHRISVYFAEAHTNAEVDRISDFSQGRTEKHPTRTAHIPISQR